jgi:hypothetical protein
MFTLTMLTPLGFATKVYTGPAAWWTNGDVGGVSPEALEGTFCPVI